MKEYFPVAIAVSGPLTVAVAGAPPPPEVLWWAPYVITGVFGLAAAGLTVVGNVYAARKSARAAFKKEESTRMLTDGDPSNDERARELALEAHEDQAEAEAVKEGAGKLADKIRRR